MKYICTITLHKISIVCSYLVKKNLITEKFQLIILNFKYTYETLGRNIC